VNVADVGGTVDAIRDRGFVEKVDYLWNAVRGEALAAQKEEGR